GGNLPGRGTVDIAFDPATQRYFVQADDQSPTTPNPRLWVIDARTGNLTANVPLPLCNILGCVGTIRGLQFDSVAQKLYAVRTDAVNPLTSSFVSVVALHDALPILGGNLPGRGTVDIAF